MDWHDNNKYIHMHGITLVLAVLRSWSVRPGGPYPRTTDPGSSSTKIRMAIMTEEGGRGRGGDLSTQQLRKKAGRQLSI